jgi:hypothetical protein
MLALLTSIALGAGPRAEALVNAKDSLGPLNGFTVTIDLEDRLRIANLDRRGLEAQVDAALRRSNVHLYRYAGTRQANPPGTPGEEGQLRLEIVVVQGTTGDDPLAVARFDLSAAQWVRPEADDSATALARTWTDGGVVTAPASKLAALLRDALGGSLDRFCADYASSRAYWLARQRARAAEGPSR